MLRLKHRRGHSPEKFLHRSLHASSARDRERFSALYHVSLGQTVPQVATLLHRQAPTVRAWLQQYNTEGLRALHYHPSGGRPCCLTAGEQAVLYRALLHPPRRSGITQGRWDGPAIMRFCRERFQKHVSHQTANAYLHRLDFVLKQPQKRFKKANPKQKQAFLRQMRRRRHARNSLRVYIDEGHTWQDCDLRRMWVPKGAVALVDSTSPGKKRSIIMLLFFLARGRCSGITSNRFVLKRQQSFSGVCVNAFLVVNSRFSWTERSTIGVQPSARLSRSIGCICIGCRPIVLSSMRPNQSCAGFTRK